MDNFESKNQGGLSQQELEELRKKLREQELARQKAQEQVAPKDDSKKEKASFEKVVGVSEEDSIQNEKQPEITPEKEEKYKDIVADSGLNTPPQDKSAEAEANKVESNQPEAIVNEVIPEYILGEVDGESEINLDVAENIESLVTTTDDNSQELNVKDDQAVATDSTQTEELISNVRSENSKESNDEASADESLQNQPAEIIEEATDETSEQNTHEKTESDIKSEAVADESLSESTDLEPQEEKSIEDENIEPGSQSNESTLPDADLEAIPLGDLATAEGEPLYDSSEVIENGTEVSSEAMLDLGNDEVKSETITVSDKVKNELSSENPTNRPLSGEKITSKSDILNKQIESKVIEKEVESSESVEKISKLNEKISEQSAQLLEQNNKLDSIKDTNAKLINSIANKDSQSNNEVTKEKVVKRNTSSIISGLLFFLPFILIITYLYLIYFTDLELPYSEVIKNLVDKINPF